MHAKVGKTWAHTMSTAAKLTTSVITTIVLIFGVEFAVVASMSNAGFLQIIRAIARHFFLNNSFNGFLGFFFLFSFVAFPIFDCLSIICFRYGWDSVNREIDIYGGVEGSTGPKLSTRQKVTVIYPFFITLILLLVAVLAGRQKDLILEMGL
jgi:hypothetical protein